MFAQGRESWENLISTALTLLLLYAKPPIERNCKLARSRMAEISSRHFPAARMFR